MMSELLQHLMAPLTDGGHGFETGVPATVDNVAELHENDHFPTAWWHDVITHEHEKELAP